MNRCPHEESHGPGFASPLAAFSSGLREDVLYVTCARAPGSKLPDFLATVDVNPESDTYCAIIAHLNLAPGDEIHHLGWNSCSSCYSSPLSKRSHLVAPCLNSSRIYMIDTCANPRKPALTKVVDLTAQNCGLSFPHTAHCLADGNIIISTLGDAEGNASGNFLLLDGKTFDIRGKWSLDSTPFGYDFWYQPKHNVMVSSSWGSPKAIKAGFDPADLQTGLYGSQLYVWNWSERRLIETFELGADGCMALEVRFCHEPTSSHGFVGAAVGGAIFHVWSEKEGANEKWHFEKAAQIRSRKVDGWLLPDMPPVLSDILISMDDRFLYASAWVHGELRQYDITDPFHLRLTNVIVIGGSLCAGGPVKAIDDDETPAPPMLYVKGKRIYGGPQMLQLSLDGRRLYVTTSLYSVWDAQFYPDIIKNGATLLRVDVDVTRNGAMTINEGFLVEFDNVDGEPSLAHEMRYPGGDCTSDIWI